MVRVSNRQRTVARPMRRGAGTCGRSSLLLLSISFMPVSPIQQAATANWLFHIIKGEHIVPRWFCRFQCPLPAISSASACANRVDAAQKSLRRGSADFGAGRSALHHGNDEACGIFGSAELSSSQTPYLKGAAACPHQRTAWPRSRSDPPAPTIATETPHHMRAHRLKLLWRFGVGCGIIHKYRHRHCRGSAQAACDRATVVRCGNVQTHAQKCRRNAILNRRCISRTFVRPGSRQ